MDYEFWLRLRFTLGKRPRHLRRVLALYRMHDESKSVAHQAAMGAEIASLIRTREAGRGHVARLQVRLARRHRRGRVHGARALECLRGRRFSATLGELRTAFAACRCCGWISAPSSPSTAP